MRATWVAGVLLVVAAGCSGPVAAPAPGAAPTSAAQPTPSRGPAIALPAPGATAIDPVTGVAYPYDLPTHCGIRWARFGGRDWAPPSTLPEPGPPPVGPDGIGRYNGYTRGTMTLVASDVARFEVDGTGQRVDFAPIGQPPPPCA